VLHM
jgi:hypothetical protein